MVQINIKKACFYTHKEKLKTIRILHSPSGYPAIQVSSIGFFNVKHDLYFYLLLLVLATLVSIFVCSSIVNVECVSNINIDFIGIYVQYICLWVVKLDVCMQAQLKVASNTDIRRKRVMFNSAVNGSTVSCVLWTCTHRTLCFQGLLGSIPQVPHQAKSLYAFLTLHAVHGNDDLCAAVTLSGRKYPRTE